MLTPQGLVGLYQTEFAALVGEPIAAAPRWLRHMLANLGLVRSWRRGRRRRWGQPNGVDGVGL